MTEIIGAAGGPTDLEEAERDVSRKREDSLVRELAAACRKPGRTLDPIEFALSLHDEDLRDYVPTFPWEFEAPTSKQLAALEKSGFDIGSITTKGLASRILDRVITRSRLHLATPKQVRLLRRFGYEDAGTVTFDQARSLIDLLAANGWRRPREPALVPPVQGVPEPAVPPGSAAGLLSGVLAPAGAGIPAGREGGTDP